MELQPGTVGEIVEVLERYRLRAHRQARAQFLSARQARRLHTALGVPVIVFSSLVGTAIFASLEGSQDAGLVIGAGLVSVFSAVLAALQTFLGLAERAEKHRVSGNSYNALKRGMDLAAVRLRSATIELDDAFALTSDLLKQFADVDTDSPQAPDKFYDQARAEQLDDDEAV